VAIAITLSFELKIRDAVSASVPSSRKVVDWSTTN